jgi:outer membrane protein assembly factor BamA
MLNKKYIRQMLLPAIFIAAILASCTIQQRLKPGETFLRKQTVIFDNPPEEFKVSKEELLFLSKLKTNRKILAARFNLGVYNLVPPKQLAKSDSLVAIRCEKKNARRTAKGKKQDNCTNLWLWMAYTVGEPPSMLDSLKMKKSAEQMNIYLHKKGFFNSAVEPVVRYKRKRAFSFTKGNIATIEFHVKPAQAYHLRNIEYKFEDASIALRKDDIAQRSILKTGSIFTVDNLDKEREAVASYLNERGYYAFTKDYILYDADSSLGTRQVDISFILKNPRKSSDTNPDSLVILDHKRYYIGEVFINTVYNSRQPEARPSDTLRYDHLMILSNGVHAVKPSLLAYVTTIGPGEIYKKSNIDLTYKRLVQLGVFKSVTIQMVPRNEVDATGLNFLDINILLTPAQEQKFGFDPRITNRAGNMGIYGNLVYGHKNLNKGAQRLEARIIGGFEATQTVVQNASGTSTSQQLERNLKLNTFEIGPEVTLRIPMLNPFSLFYFKKSSEPTSTFSALMNYQIRPDYERTLVQFNGGFTFIENPNAIRRVNCDIAELSIIKINKSQAFEDFISRLQDTFLANSYRDHMILASRIGLSWNTQKPQFQRFYFYWRSNFEGAGNALNGLMKVTNAVTDESGSYKIAGIQYAQYFRGETDLRYYLTINDKNQFVFRQYIGAGFARKNLLVLPFEKSFFSGGANGLRAWQARTLGPGSFRDSTSYKTFNNIGDIKLEANFEYRFKLTKMFQAALFIDAGNIWLARPQGSRGEGEFELNRFASEIAIGSGVGLRLDFEFFIVRLDLGFQMKDPAKVRGERWFYQPKTQYEQFLDQHDFEVERYSFFKTRVLNLGIGFPF